MRTRQELRITAQPLKTSFLPRRAEQLIEPSLFLLIFSALWPKSTSEVKEVRTAAIRIRLLLRLPIDSNRGTYRLNVRLSRQMSSQIGQSQQPVSGGRVIVVLCGTLTGTEILLFSGKMRFRWRPNRYRGQCSTVEALLKKYSSAVLLPRLARRFPNLRLIFRAAVLSRIRS